MSWPRGLRMIEPGRGGWLLGESQPLAIRSWEGGGTTGSQDPSYRAPRSNRDIRNTLKLFCENPGGKPRGY